jgi:single-stranded DNA-binding protein
LKKRLGRALTFHVCNHLVLQMSHLLTAVGVARNVRHDVHQGRKVCRFALPVPSGPNRTMWLNCSVWGDQQRQVVDAIVNGSNVSVAGTLSTAVYRDNKTNQDAVSHFVHVLHVSFLSGMGRSQDMVCPHMKPTDHT